MPRERGEKKTKIKKNEARAKPPWWKPEISPRGKNTVLWPNMKDGWKRLGLTSTNF